MTFWAGIDCGYSYLTVAILDEVGRTLDIGDARLPLGNGHERSVALARLQAVLPELQRWRDRPIILAGYCYTDSGVRDAFETAGWQVVGDIALNDVVGVYGLSQMQTHVVVCGCGSFSQLVYVDTQHNICWLWDTLAAELPQWPLCGEAYARFIQHAYGDTVANGLLSDTLNLLPTQQYLRQAAQAIRATRDIFWHHSGMPTPPMLVLGGGAIRHAGLWQFVARELATGDCAVERVTDEQAIGLAQFAMRYRTANAWGHIGDKPPSWLSGA